MLLMLFFASLAAGADEPTGPAPVSPQSPPPVKVEIAPAASQPARPPIERIPPRQVVESFLAWEKSHSEAGDSARQFIESKSADAAGDNASDFMNQALAVLSPDFKTALDRLFDEKYSDAADLFEKLADSKDPYLAVAAAGYAGTALVESEQIERCGAMLDRVMSAYDAIERYTTSPESIRFLVGFCQVMNLDYQKGQASLSAFLTDYPDAPERLRVTATQMLTELSSRAPGELGDVYDLMNYARRRISHGDTDKPVVQRQTEAVALLNVLIEEAEEQEKNQSQGEGEGDGGGGGKPNGNKGGGSGAKRSSLPQGGSGKENLAPTRARPGEAWGRMPPKQREQILQTLQKQFPARYRELLEQYYEQLAKEQPAP